MARGRCKPRNASRTFFSSRAHHLRMCRHSCCVQYEPTVVLVAQRGAVIIWRAGLLVTPIGHRLPVRFDSESCTKVRQDEKEGGTEGTQAKCSPCARCMHLPLTSTAGCGR